MKGKKAFELSMTFLVMLILIIVIFTGAISFTKKFFSSAEEMRATIDRQTEAEIEALLYQEGSLVAVPIFKKTVPRGQQASFGLGIRNIAGEASDFYVLISFSKGFTVEEEVIIGTDREYMNTKWLLYNPGPYRIENNKLEMIPILTMADLKISDTENTQRGTYAFNICVILGTIPTGFDCASPPRPLPPSVYGERIYKIYVEVR